MRLLAFLTGSKAKKITVSDRQAQLASHAIDVTFTVARAEAPTDGSAMRYRLPHERLIPALYRLTGKLLAEVGSMELEFQIKPRGWPRRATPTNYIQIS